VTAHTHREFIPGCYRCDLGREEAEWAASHPDTCSTWCATNHKRDGACCLVWDKEDQ
jgi:hypothetical protein